MSRRPLARTVALVASVGFGLTAPLPHAQTPERAFDAASIKPNNSGGTSETLSNGPGSFRASNVTLRTLVVNAYQLRFDQVIGGPSWISADRFDVNAKALGDAGDKQLHAMLRNLLADRFQLRMHTETRDQPIYALLVAREEKRGPQLTPSTVDCTRTPLPPRCANSAMGSPGGVTVRLTGQPISALLGTLGAATQRTVIDRTGLTGLFDVDLRFRNETIQATSQPSANDFPSLFTALQEQLGLKLESTRGPVDVLVIDSVERPSPD